MLMVLCLVLLSPTTQIIDTKTASVSRLPWIRHRRGPHIVQGNFVTAQPHWCNNCWKMRRSFQTPADFEIFRNDWASLSKANESIKTDNQSFSTLMGFPNQSALIGWRGIVTCAVWWMLVKLKYANTCYHTWKVCAGPSFFLCDLGAQILSRPILGFYNGHLLIITHV